MTFKGSKQLLSGHSSFRVVLSVILICVFIRFSVTGIICDIVSKSVCIIFIVKGIYIGAVNVTLSLPIREAEIYVICSVIFIENRIIIGKQIMKFRIILIKITCCVIRVLKIHGWMIDIYTAYLDLYLLNAGAIFIDLKDMIFGIVTALEVCGRKHFKTTVMIKIADPVTGSADHCRTV